jgi:hypothetical protein
VESILTIIVEANAPKRQIKPSTDLGVQVLAAFR